MRLRTLIIAVAVLAAGGLILLAAGYLILRSMDLNNYRPEIIAQVKAATGRELVIGGELSIGLDDGLVIRADDLALANAAWGTRPQMLTLGRAQARVALLPLFSGDIRIKQVGLRDVDLLLETDASGAANWELGSKPSTTQTPAIDVRSIVIESGQLTWKTASAPHRPPLQLAGLELVADIDGSQRVLKASARIGDEKIELKGRLPSLGSWSSGTPQDLELRLRASAATIQANGTIQREPWGLSPRLKLHAERMDLAALGRLAGRSLPALPLLDLAFDLSREADTWRIADLEAKAGASDLTGELRISTGTGRRHISGSLASKRLDLTTLLPAPAASGDTASGAGEIFTTTPLELGALRTLDGELQLRLAQVKGWGYGLRNVQLDGQLRSGRLTLRPFKAGIDGGGHAEGKFELDLAPDLPSWAVDLKVRQIPAAALLGPQHASLIEAPVDLELDLRTKGASPKRMKGNLAGDVHLLVGKGRARLRSVDRMVGGLTNLTGLLLEQGSDDAQLNCAVADFAIESGVAKANVLLIDSAVSTVRGDGQVDLGAEQVDLTFTPHPKKPTLSVAVPVHVRGPLRQPQFIADRKASLTKLIGVAGIFVYPPAALATLGDLGGSNNECIRLMQGDTSTSESSSPADKVKEGIGGAAKGIGKGLKGLFGQ